MFGITKLTEEERTTHIRVKRIQELHKLNY